MKLEDSIHPEQAPPKDPATESFTIAHEAVPQLDQARARSVRLVISIPVLTLLIVLGSGTLLYVYLMNIAENRDLGKDLSENVERAALAILLLSILISIASSVVGYVLARQIVRPIRDLMRRMESIMQGDLSKVEPISLGEFGQLGNTFNRMVDQLNRLFEERDRQLRESFNGAHLVLDRQGRVLQADAATQRLFGEAPTTMVGRALLDAREPLPVFKENPALVSALQDVIQAAIGLRQTRRAVSIRLPGSRSFHRFLLSALPMESGATDEVQVLLAIRDISGISNFYEQIQRADRLAAVGTLATGLAHEIRNPLASIRGMVQLLSEGGSEPDDKERLQEYTRRILKEVDRLDGLIGGIMDFAQKEDTPVEEVSLNALLQEVWESARLHVGEAARDVGVSWDLDEALPVASLEAGRLRQALLNLVVNALQHCAQHGHRTIRIHSMYLPVNPKRPLILCISNPGEPLDEEMRERVFEPFFTTKPEGTGLGLPIAYQTVKANGGVLELECEEGEIRFWVRLPREVTGSRSVSRLINRADLEDL